MRSGDAAPTPPDDLSEALIQRIDALERAELQSLLSYIEQRIDSRRTALEADIETTAAGEVLEIEDHGGYALVRQHPPDPDGHGVNTAITSLYHVRREQQVDGSESLHWAYVGDVHDTSRSRCGSCGRTLDDDVAVCPACGTGDVDRTETGE